MRPGSIFLNLSRGFVVDHGALRQHIECGHLAGAAVDVFPVEPKAKGEEFVSELRGLPNVILTPHVGGSTEEAQQDIGNFVAGKLRDYCRAGTHLAERQPAARVACPRTPGAARLLLLHRNTPGVLATRQRRCSPTTASTSRAAARHPRGARLRRHRRRRGRRGRRRHLAELPETVRLRVLR